VVDGERESSIEVYLIASVISGASVVSAEPVSSTSRVTAYPLRDTLDDHAGLKVTHLEERSR
jgi:hypothetical protein